mgnify:CR=1 FL=1
MFSVGDLVVHPMHGAGVIDAIVQEKVAGSTQDYYVFKMPVGGLLLKIPTANSQTIGVRSVIQRPEAEALIGGEQQLEQAVPGKSAADEERGSVRGGTCD